MILLFFHIERASYPGGDLTSKNLLTLFKNAKHIFSQLEEKLQESTRASSHSEQEIKQRCNKTKEFCVFLDYMFSLALTHLSDANYTIIETTEKCVKAVEQKWNDLHLSLIGKKIHAIIVHVIQHMRKWRGIGCFVEDYVEKLHQTGKKEEKRTGNMTH